MKAVAKTASLTTPKSSQVEAVASTRKSTNGKSESLQSHLSKRAGRMDAKEYFSADRPMQAGDIVGFSGDSALSLFINVVTYGIPWWSLSHVGILGESKDGELLLFESTTLDDEPCVIQGKLFKGSQAHRLDSRLKSYRGKVWHYPVYRPLYTYERIRLNRFLNSTIGIPYDEIGAFRSGGIGFSWVESQLRESDLSSLFCSEWCCAAHVDIGLFHTDNVSRWSPNRFVRAERRQELLLRPRRLK